MKYLLTLMFAVFALAAFSQTTRNSTIAVQPNLENTVPLPFQPKFRYDTTAHVLYARKDGIWKMLAEGASQLLAQDEVFYVDPNGDNATAVKGRIDKPWVDPWAVTSSLPSTRHSIVLNPGFYSTGVDSADNSHVFMSDTTYILAEGAKIKLNSQSSNYPLFTDFVGASTVPRFLKVVGGEWEVFETGTTSFIFGSRLSNPGSFSDLSLDKLKLSGGRVFGFYGDASTKVRAGEFETSGGIVVSINNQVDAAGANVSLVTRDVDILLDKVIMGGDTDTGGAIRYQNSSRDSLSNIKVVVNEMHNAPTSVKPFFLENTTGGFNKTTLSFEYKGLYNWKNSTFLTPSEGFTDGSANLGAMDVKVANMDSSTIKLGFEHLIVENGPIFGNFVGVDADTLRNSIVEFNYDKVRIDTGALMILEDWVLEDNSKIIITCNDCVSNGSPFFSFFNFTIDNTSEIVVRGNYTVNASKPVIETRNEIRLEGTFTNDGTVPTIQSDGPVTVYVSGAFDQNTIILDPDVTFARLDEYGFDAIENSSIANTLFVRKSGNDLTAEIGDFFKPWASPLAASMADGDTTVLSFSPGVYTWGDGSTFDVNTTGLTSGEHTIAQGERTIVNLPEGATLDFTKHANMATITDWSDGFGSTLSPIDVTVQGGGNLLYSDNSSSLGVLIGVYDDSSRVKLDLNDITSFGSDHWVCQLNCIESFIKVNDVYGEGRLLFSIRGLNGNHRLIAENLVSNSVSTSPGRIRMQTDNILLHEIKGINVNIDVENFTLQGSTASAFIIDPQTLEFDSVYVNLDFQNIDNFAANGTLQSAYGSSFNDNATDFTILGGADTSEYNTIIVDVDRYKSNQQAIHLDGGLWKDSEIIFRGNFESDGIPIRIHDVQLINSTIKFEGKFTSNEMEVVNIYNITGDSLSSISFDGDFITKAIDKPAVSVGNVEKGVLVFRNSSFRNDGSFKSFTTNQLTDTIIIKNSILTSVVSDSIVVEGSAIADGTGIYTGDGTVPTETDVSITDNLRFNDGRVGIGVTGTPGRKFHVADAEAPVRFESTDTGGSDHWLEMVNQSTNLLSSNVIRFYNGGTSGTDIISFGMPKNGLDSTAYIGLTNDTGGDAARGYYFSMKHLTGARMEPYGTANPLITGTPTRYPAFDAEGDIIASETPYIPDSEDGTPTAGSGFTVAGASVIKEGNIVCLAGHIGATADDTAITSGVTTILTLPAGFRPGTLLHQNAFTNQIGDDLAQAFVWQVNTDGTVKAVFIGGDTFDLDAAESMYLSGCFSVN